MHTFLRIGALRQAIDRPAIDLVRRHRLIGESDYSFGSGWGVDLAYGSGFEALRDTVATGRAYLEDETSPLVWIEAVEGRLAWRRIGSARVGEELRLILLDASQPEGSESLLATDADYVQFVMASAAESYSKQYGT